MRRTVIKGREKFHLVNIKNYNLVKRKTKIEYFNPIFILPNPYQMESYLSFLI